MLSIRDSNPRMMQRRSENKVSGWLSELFGDDILPSTPSNYPFNNLPWSHHSEARGLSTDGYRYQEIYVLKKASLLLQIYRTDT